MSTLNIYCTPLYNPKNWGDSGELNLSDAISEMTILTASRYVSYGSCAAAVEQLYPISTCIVRCLHGPEVRENMFADVARLYTDLGEKYWQYVRCLLIICGWHD